MATRHILHNLLSKSEHKANDALHEDASRLGTKEAKLVVFLQHLLLGKTISQSFLTLMEKCHYTFYI